MIEIGYDFNIKDINKIKMLTWPSLVELLKKFFSTFVALRSFILCFLDCYT